MIDEFVELMDQESTYPALLHCKAGLHRTGVLTAIYRMEYQGWSRRAAFHELRAHGFGDWVSTTANPYIDQYIFRYRPRAHGDIRISACGGESRGAARAVAPTGRLTPGADGEDSGMLKHIDRLMVLGYLKSYTICLTSLLVLYIVVDMFTNLDDFLHKGSTGLVPVLLRIGSYYGYRIPQLFDRLCEVIVLLAAMFTVAMMQRNNEQVPLLSAGISTQRIVAPVLISACLMLCLAIVNQELIIPRIQNKLTQDRNDPNGDKDVLVRGCYEPNLILITGKNASRKNAIDPRVRGDHSRKRCRQHGTHHRQGSTLSAHAW